MQINPSSVFRRAGKIVCVADKDGRELMRFGYDEAGNRVEKRVFPETAGGPVKTTQYARDASGNVLAVYEIVETPDLTINPGAAPGDPRGHFARLLMESLAAQGGDGAAFADRFLDAGAYYMETMMLNPGGGDGKALNFALQRARAQYQKVVEDLDAGRYGSTVALLESSPSQLAAFLETSAAYVEGGELDASALANYPASLRAQTGGLVYRRAEAYLYGAARLGADRAEVVLFASGSADALYSAWHERQFQTGFDHPPTGYAQPPDPEANKPHIRGQKRYELSNHLGNVLAVVSDKRVAEDGASDLVAKIYDGEVFADIHALQDYYPFGMEMPGRTASLYHNTATQTVQLVQDIEAAPAPSGTYVRFDQYRFGFQGQESDDEWKGEGNAVSYKYRVHHLGNVLAVVSDKRVVASTASLADIHSLQDYRI